MTTLVQNATQTVVENSYIDVQTDIVPSRFGSLMDDWTFRITEVRETERVATSSMGRVSILPEDALDALTQSLGSLSLFRRTKEQVVLDPSLQLGSNVQFTKFIDLEDGQVPVVTLDDIKGGKVKIPPLSHDSEDTYSPQERNPTLPSNSLSLSYDLNLDNFLEGELELENQQRILAQHTDPSHIATDTLPPHHNHVTLSDITSCPGADDYTNHPPTAVPVLARLHTEAWSEQVEPFEFTANPLLSQVYIDSFNEVLSNTSPSVPYPFEETPARVDLPFEIPATPLRNQSLQDLESLFEQTISNATPGYLFQDRDYRPFSHLDNSLSISDWGNGPPSLSPSCTDTSQDSTLYTPISDRSPISLSFVSRESSDAAIPLENPLPTQDDLASYVDPALLSLDKMHFKEPFSAFVATEDTTRYRPIQRVVELHEQIMTQVAPYPIGPPAPKLKPTLNNKGKGKAKAKAKAESDGDGADDDEARDKEPKKKKKRDEADKVRCEIDGCNGTFFSNWELKRHQKNLHGIGEETQSAAVCPKCGRHFASRRKDSVDRHLELNACGKRNPRKSPKRFTTNGQR